MKATVSCFEALFMENVPIGYAEVKTVHIDNIQFEQKIVILIYVTVTKRY